LVVLLDQCQGLDMVSRFLCVVAFRVSHPFYEILQLFMPPVMLVAADGLDFVLFVIINEIRWWPGVVFFMFGCFDV